MNNIRAIEVLKKAGWHENRKINILENINFLESRGFELFPAAKKFMEEFGELDILVEKKFSSGRVKTSRHSTCIKNIIGISDSSWYGLDDYIDEKVLPVGRSDNGEFPLYIGESGKMYLRLGWVGNNPLEAFENIIDKNRIILWHEYNDKN